MVLSLHGRSPETQQAPPPQKNWRRPQSVDVVWPPPPPSLEGGAFVGRYCIGVVPPPTSQKKAKRSKGNGSSKRKEEQAALNRLLQVSSTIMHLFEDQVFRLDSAALDPPALPASPILPTHRGVPCSVIWCMMPLHKSYQYNERRIKPCSPFFSFLCNNLGQKLEVGSGWAGFVGGAFLLFFSFCTAEHSLQTLPMTTGWVLFCSSFSPSEKPKTRRSFYLLSVPLSKILLYHLSVFWLFFLTTCQKHRGSNDEHLILFNYFVPFFVIEFFWGLIFSMICMHFSKWRKENH